MYPEAQEHPQEMVEARAVPRRNGNAPAQEVDRRVLTIPQQKMLNLLNERAQEARERLAEFCDYLAEEHGCEGQGWEIRDGALIRAK